METTTFTHSKRARNVILLTSVIILIFGIATVVKHDDILRIAIFIPLFLIIYSFAFTKYIITDKGLIIKGSLYAKEIIPFDKIMSVTPLSKGFQIDYTKPNGKRKNYIIKNIENSTILMEILQKSIINK